MRKESTNSQNNSTFKCIICKEEQEFTSIGHCNHKRTCLYCTMRSRLFYDKFNCPICNDKLNEIFILNFTDNRNYDELLKDKNLFYKDDEFDKCKIYYVEIEAKEKALEERGYNCPIKNCKFETFENMFELSKHLDKIHKRYYCEYCLKENKKFLREMPIYKDYELKEHIEYGEYQNNNLISPPHPLCSFCNEHYYNDEILFNHMNDKHFNCQLCNKEKHVIFYKELNNLLKHYYENHYCCPFPECIQDYYIVFGTENELVNHFIQKHKITNAKETFKEIIKENKNNFKEIADEKGEFNFTEYVKELKEKSENYKINVVSQKERFVKINDKRYDDKNNIEIIYVKENKNNYQNNNNYNKRKKGNNYYNNKFNNKYNNKNNYNKYNNQNYNNQNNNKSYHNKKYHNYNNNYNNNNYNNNYNNNNYNNNNYNEELNNKKNTTTTDDDFDIKNQVVNKIKKSLNYSSIISFYLNVIRNYIKNKIITENIEEKDVFLSKDTTYQIIVIMEKKISSPKSLIELQFLNNFGMDINIYKNLKELISSGETNEKEFENILNKLHFKNLLILYKYLFISSKKIDGLFYRLDLEQIEENLYSEFLEKKNDENKDNKEDKERKKRADLLRMELMYSKNNDIDNNNNQNSSNKKQEENNNKKIDIPNNHKSNLDKLFDGEIVETQNENIIKNKNQNKNMNLFDINNFNLDEDFPPLK